MSNDPAEIDVSREIGTNFHWGNLRGIGGGQGLEHTPWNTLKDGTDEERLDILREERDKDHGAHENESAEHGPLVTGLVRDPTVEIESENLSALASSADGSLPLGTDDFIAGAGCGTGVNLVAKAVPEPNKGLVKRQRATLALRRLTV